MKQIETSSQQTVAIFDLDSTITKKDTYIAFLLTVLKCHPYRILRCGFLPFAVFIHKTGLKDNSWLKETFLGAIAGGLTQSQLDHCTDRFLAKLHNQGIRQKALQKIQQHREANHQLVLASASFDFYVKKLGNQLGFDTIICTRSKWNEQKKLIGKIDGYNCYGHNKLKRLVELIDTSRNNIFRIGYTDHHSDQPLLEWVDKAIAVNPTKKLQQIALNKKYIIVDWGMNNA